MLYATRNTQGRIIGISDAYSESCELVEIDHPEVKDFLSIQQEEEFNPDSYLGESDIAIARILDDLVDLLVKKNIIMFTELPDQAQRKLLSRRVVRSLMQEPGTKKPSPNTETGASFLSDDESFL